MTAKTSSKKPAARTKPAATKATAFAAPRARQIRSGAVLREALATKKVSPAVRQTHPTAIDEFKNAYDVEFLGLGADHSEADFHGALLRNLGRFLTELGRDFCFVGSQYPVQVGNQDFAIDLVFFHRGLQCLVAFELTVDKFKPADLGQLSFYVEALDRDVKKPHERPSIGVLLCATSLLEAGASFSEIESAIEVAPHRLVDTITELRTDISVHHLCAFVSEAAKRHEREQPEEASAP